MYQIENKISSELIDFLRFNKIINIDEKVLSIEKPGEGNMNQVLRLITNERSIILKQSRNFVNKYPQIEAPIGRILVEAEFYHTISKNENLKAKMPNLIGFLPKHYLLVLEDLGQNTDFTSIYKPNSTFSESEVIELAEYLNNLHAIDIKGYPSNSALKQLNHFHIFDFPFQLENGFDLDQIQNGLQEISSNFKNNIQLKNKVKELGESYLRTDETLIHGDFYPGSWLKTDKGIKIIDPEFGYLGRPEFDLAIFIAHLAIASKTQYISTLNANYHKKIDFDNQLMCAFAGVEIIRRLLGVAQLPINLNLEEKKQLLADANTLVFSEKKQKNIDIEKLIKI